MAKLNCTRAGCKDVYRAFLVEDAEYDGVLEIPKTKLETSIPSKLIPFSKAMSANDHDQWIHFYEDDYVFERLWNNPQKYLPMISRFNGIISPDFSIYRDMPLVMQQWNTYRGRAIAHWLQEQGISVIPNIRFGDSRSYKFCCAGVPKGGTIAVGSHGCIRNHEDVDLFKEGLLFTVTEVAPKAIVVYGATPNEIFAPCKKQGIEVCRFESDFSSARKAVSA